MTTAKVFWPIARKAIRGFGHFSCDCNVFLILLFEAVILSSESRKTVVVVFVNLWVSGVGGVSL